MSRNKFKLIFAFIAASLLIITACVKDVTVTLTDNKEVTKKVSFSKDLVPLFVANCAISGCHVAEKQVPDLEKDVAYKSLMNLNLIDVGTPENSTLYKRLTGKITPAMPAGKPTNPSNINNLVLAWIKQGANNN